MPEVYSFDSDSFIAPWRGFYRPEFIPDFWDSLDGLIREGRLKVAEPVYEEILQGGDELSEWFEARKQAILYPWDITVQQAVREIQQKHPNIVKSTGKSGADPWVVAVAKAMGGCVVTFEKKSGADARHIKIPNVCESFSIRCMTVYEVIAEEEWVFGRLR